MCRARSGISVATVLVGLLVGCGGSSSNPATPVLTPGVTLSAASLSFGATTIGTPAAIQMVTVTNSGSAALAVAGIGISGTNATSFAESNTCGSSLAAGTSCTVSVTFTPAASGSLTASLTIADNASGSPQSVALSGTGSAATYTLSLSGTTLTFPSTLVGATSAAQTLTFTNTGTGTLSAATFVASGANYTSFNEASTTCGASLAPGASCSVSINFIPAGSGPATAVFTVTDNAANSPQTITLNGTGTATPPALATIDCSVSTALCPNTFSTANLGSDPIAVGGFHGYADPSMRKDPNSTTIYYAYSWAKTLADGTHVVDLHLAQSTNSGATFTYVGPLYQSTQTTQTASSAYSSVNDSSTETIDLLPIPLTGASAGQTLWVQAHQSYLVAPTGGIYDQLNVTGMISVTAVQLATPAAANAGTALLALGTAPEARLGVFDTDASRNPTQNLASLTTAAAKCGNFGQSALWYQSGTLYLALECTEIAGSGNIDANELAHFVFSTTPTGSDASKWTWAYAGEFLTGAQAAKLGTVEGATYSFFTEPEFVQTKSGQLAVLATPGVFAPQTSQQPVIQYGCRLFPVTLTPTSVTLAIDPTTNAPVDLAKITENDLYTGVNEGPAACTYEPAATNGIIMGRKYENDPTLGFYLYPVNSTIMP